MQKEEAALIIQTMAESIRLKPNQFNFNVNASLTGQSVVSYGGVGMSVTAVGGAAGSSVIGNQVSTSSGDVSIVYDAVNKDLDAKMAGLIDSLAELSRQLRSEKPDKNLIGKTLDLLKASWIPQVISAVATAVTKIVIT